MIKTLINSVEEFQDWCGTLGDVIAIDFETTGLSYLEMEFLGFSLCDGDRACYVQNKRLLTYLEALISSRTWVMHNAKFDLKCFQKFVGSIPENIFCTLTGAKLVDENLYSYSLKELASFWLGIPYDQIKKWEEVSGDADSPEFIDYAMNDAIWTFDLYEYITPRLAKEQLTYISGIEMEFQKVLADMEMNGVFIDKNKLREFKGQVPRLLDGIQVEMCELLKIPCGYNTNLFGIKELWTGAKFSSSDVKIKIAEDLGFEIIERTKPSKSFPRGKKSFDKRTKARLKGKHPFFDLIHRFGKLNHLNNSFIKPAEDFIDSDGRIRPSYDMVRTGRLSCSKPNLQQLPNPKKEKLEFNHREVFIPEEGNVLVKGDYSGQELRVLGEVTNDDTMVDAFQNNRDLHLTTANHIFSLDLSMEALTDGTEEHDKATGEYKQKRHQAKNGVNFPIVYGATAGRIATDNKVSKEEAERWLDGFFKLYPKVKEAIDFIPKELRRFGFVTTIFGRRRRFPNYSSADRYERLSMERQAFNMKIQGSSADIGKIAGVLLYKSLPSYAKMVLFVHDEFCVETPKEHADKIAKLMKTCMENAVALKVRMIVETKIVENLG
jgi:DNA polymerase-1